MTLYGVLTRIEISNFKSPLLLFNDEIFHFPYQKFLILNLYLHDLYDNTLNISLCVCVYSGM